MEPACCYRPPLYPFFLAAIYSLFGHSYEIVRNIQAILSSFCVLLVYNIALKINGKRTAQIAACMMSVYPLFLVFVNALLTESIYTFFLLFFTTLLIRIPDRPDWRIALACGVILGLTALTREIPFYFSFVASAWLF